MSKISDKELFYDYHLYLFEIYMQDQMDGWVDQFDVISDASDMVSDNSDLFFTKSMLPELAKLSLGRSHHIIIFDMGIIARLFTKIIFPLLPDYFVGTIYLFGDEREAVVAKIKEYMAYEVIPHFLGGGNYKTNDELAYSSSYDKSTKNTLESTESERNI